MFASLRSTTGCAACKTRARNINRRKKCDETKPQCLRCLASRRSCSYEYIEYPEDGRRRVKRTKPAPRTASEGLVIASRSGLPSTSGTTTTPSISGQSTALAPSNLPETLNGESYSDPNHIVLHSAATPLNSLIHPQKVPSGPSHSLTSSNLVPWSPEIIPAATCLTLQESTILSYEDEDEDGDPEGVRALLCPILTMDKNVKDNTLPFVLHCHFQWAIVRVFVPLKIAHGTREQVIAQFSSKKTRTRSILIANVMDVFTRNLSIDSARMFILDQLVLDGHNGGSSLVSAVSSAPALNRHQAMHMLNTILETFALQIFTQPLAACIQTLGYAAPVFRCACSEPPGQPINLANIMLESNISLQYFANLDIIQSVTSGRPTHVQYEVPFSPELCEQTYLLQDSYSLQWYLGFPVQFILLFAWINSMCEIPGASDNSELVTWIETILPQIKIATDGSGDPLLRIGRMVVQECWRFAVLIYLYMVLCKADAHDPRVKRAQQGFMRLVRGVKPGRNPDAHLSPSMVVAGVATILEQDRDTLRQRILGIQEFTGRGTVGNDYVLELEDIWARTKDEGRPAVWSDLRITCFNVTGS
ncbi:unnamed protein product [Rhizoctonia solani]|uniref:Zn(2)-C6 fungal-type domain-containing protein n=1 Tax=Rhizoctonia solani TaxID=456999 RepID=A0A8H3H023_9AGAM|nr:unnamed protein product [Rhizoctonia solani]